MNKKLISIAVIGLLIICSTFGALCFVVKKNSTVSITFDSNGGTSVSSQALKKGEKVEKPEDPQKSGYEFEGWYKDLNDEKAFDFNTEIKDDETLVAKWSEIYQKDNNGFFTNSSTSQTQQNENNNQSLDSNLLDIVGNSTYTVKHYKMNLDGTTYAEPEVETKTGKINDKVTPEVKQYAGFTAPNTQTVFVNNNGSTVVDYYYTRNKYTVNLVMGEGISEINGAGTYYYEQEVPISAKVSNGYTFNYWVDDNQNKNQNSELSLKIGTSDINIIAMAKPVSNIASETNSNETQYNSTSSDQTTSNYNEQNQNNSSNNNSNSNSNSNSNQNNNSNSSNKITSKPQQNTTNSNSSSGQAVTVTSDANKDTTYIVKHYKMNVDGKTYGKPETETKNGKVGRSVTPDVKVYEGFTSPNTKTVKIDKNGKTVVKYYYKRNQYKLDLKANNGISEVIGSGTYYYGQEVKIKAKADLGYVFNYWEDEFGNHSKKNESTVRIGAKNSIITANGKLDENIPYTVKHYKMNVDGKTYGIPDIETKKGTMDEEVTPAVKKYEGFTAPDKQTVKISAKGNTVVEYYYTRNKYELALEANEGIEKVTGAGTYYYGQQVTLKAEVKSGYIFDYWEDEFGNHSNKTEVTVKIGAGDSTITANAKLDKNVQYQVKHYKMNVDGKTYAEPEIEKKKGNIKKEVTPAVKKYEGFTSPKTQTVKIDGNGKTVIEYYYTRNRYKLELKKNKGIEEVKGSGTYYYEEEVTIKATAQEGYKFDYWKAGENEKYLTAEAKIKMGAKDKTITANAKIREYTITYDANGGTTKEPKQELSYGTKLAKPKNPTRKGYTFLGWYADLKDETTFNFDTTMPKKDFTLYAKWKANEYTIVFNSNGGKGKMDNQEFTYDKEAKLNQNKFTKEHYTFAGWSETAKGKVQYKDKQEVKNVAENGKKNLYAIWTPVKYKITYDLDGGKETSKNKTEYTIEDSFKLNPPTKDGYVFKEWILKDKTVLKDATIKKGTTGNLEIKATWEKSTKVKVIFNSNNGESKKVEQTVELKDKNATLKANTFAKTYTVTYDYNYNSKNKETEKANSKFLGWATSANGKVEYKDKEKVSNLKSNGSTLNLYAKWEDKTINLKKNPTRSNYSFVGWSINKDKSGIIFEETYKVTKNITLTAMWNDNTPRIETISFKVIEDGKTHDAEVGVGDGAFYARFPKNGRVIVTSLKLKTNVPIKLNDKAKQASGYIDIKTSKSENNGLKGKVSVMGINAMSIKSKDGKTWEADSSDSELSVSVSTFKTLLGGIKLGIAKGFGVSKDGNKETPHYVASVVEINGDTYLFFKEEKTKDVKVKFNNGTKDVLTLNVPKGSLVPNVSVVGNEKFDGWYKDKALKTQFNFKNPIYADITIYGKNKEQNSK